jgi:hypothetical protein
MEYVEDSQVNHITHQLILHGFAWHGTMHSLQIITIPLVCNCCPGILTELVRQGHEVILFTLEDEPEDLPELEAVYTLPHFLMPAYPDKKVAKIDFPTLRIIFAGMRKHRPDVIHCTADGIAQAFAMAGIFLGTFCWWWWWVCFHLTTLHDHVT